MLRPLAAGSALALAVAAVALAQEPAEVVTDARGDSPGAMDLTRVELARGTDGRLRAELTMASPWTAQTLRGTGEGPPASACARLYVKADPESDPPDYLVCVTPADEGEAYNGQVLRQRVDGPPKRLAGASIVRPTSRTVYLRFAQTTIHKPASLRFSAEVTVPGPACPRPLGCRDVAPDAPDTARLILRRTRSAE